MHGARKCGNMIFFILIGMEKNQKTYYLSTYLILSSINISLNIHFCNIALFRLRTLHNAHS